jgi:hypothetical protein
MIPTIDVWLDEEQQIIHQRVNGDLDRDGYQRLQAAIAECVARLRNPADVRLLVDATRLGTMPARGRWDSLGDIRRPELGRMAFFGLSSFGRTMTRLVGIVAGEHKVRAFANEEQALEWLRS